MLYESYYGVVDLGSGQLYHHGIKGQKWGIRRFQNPDGSLTAAGKQRYFTSDGKLTKSGEKLYRRENKKLSKLKDRANMDLQRQNVEKYNKRAETSKKVALGAAAVAGLQFNAKSMDNSLVDRWDRDLQFSRQEDRRLSKEIFKAYENMSRPDNTFESYMGFSKQTKDLRNAQQKLTKDLYKRVDAYAAIDRVLEGLNKTKYIGAGVAAGAGAAYAYNKLKSRAAQKRLTDLGHEKALSDVKEQTERIKRMFGDVKLEDITFDETRKKRTTM